VPARAMPSGFSSTQVLQSASGESRWTTFTW
jgi:hypothetical protein